MANRTITSTSTTLLTALGGTVSAGDAVYIDQYPTQFVTGDISANAIISCTLTAGFSGQFAAALGTPLKIDLSSGAPKRLANYSNAARVEVISTSSAGVIDEIIHNPAGGGYMQVNTCVATKVYVLNGTLDLESLVDLSGATVEVSGGSCRMLKTAAAATYPVLTLTVGGSGQAEILRDVGTLNAEGGGTVRISESQCSPTTVNMRGGTVVINQCSAIGTLQGASGVIDLRNNKTPFTVTTRALGPGVTILRSANTIDPTYTSTTGDYGGGPVVRTV